MCMRFYASVCVSMCMFMVSQVNENKYSEKKDIQYKNRTGIFNKDTSLLEK